MPFVRIDMFEGRTKEQKAALARAVTAAVQETLGAPPEHIYVVINELPPENVAIGGVPRSKDAGHK
ncbi:MAG: 2-hydroxymuconate tautomerase family protein [Chloroflexi bacterium]|nr:2-hydroxymuconate tautomerase family protein [Chloroflexota bacterium]MDA8188189.1 2-hydroxymuconate tautomerase family protein [Dehalococcoidales bacterium]